MIYLSDHFTLMELCHTQHRDIPNTPGGAILGRLAELAHTYLEALRTKFGPLYVSSGYRCPELNTLIGGAPDSAHLYGYAADVVPLKAGVTVPEMQLWVRDESGLEWDQVIDEKGAGPTGWLHFGYAHPHYPKPRHECLRMRCGEYTHID